ncbi:MAG TPA: Calx-beta domain-containing protein, partial [Vicinamibacterales bacterium]|nr:Calx-beta domain-containing protein [Vicinamibacterales bacterium]
GRQVTVPESCVIRHGNTFYTLGDLSVGDRVHVKGRRLTSGTGTLATTTIEATEVKLQNPGAPSGDDDDDGDDDDGDDDDDDSTGASVSVSAFDANAAETGGDLGTFRFTRTGSTVSALTVTFTVSGTATAGTDYQSLPVSVTIAAGATTADLFVIALPDGATEGTETVIVTVSDGASYNVGAVSATVNIAG